MVLNRAERPDQNPKPPDCRDGAVMEPRQVLGEADKRCRKDRVKSRLKGGSAESEADDPCGTCGKTRDSPRMTGSHEGTEDHKPLRVNYPLTASVGKAETLRPVRMVAQRIPARRQWRVLARERLHRLPTIVNRHELDERIDGPEPLPAWRPIAAWASIDTFTPNVEVEPRLKRQA